MDFDEVARRLAASRPVFHSEADLQHAFAWEVHSLDPNILVRLETHPEPAVRLDVLLARPDLQRHSAIELKYPTALWAGAANGEQFALKNHGAQDITSYDIVKDVNRVEHFVSAREGWNGLVLVLTNDASYWRTPSHGRVTNAGAFRTHEGLTVTGERTWGPATGAGTMKNREAALNLRGSYDLRWRDYSRLGGRNGDFRLLVIEVA